MRVAIACDHGGFSLKKAVLDAVAQSGHEAVDLGTYDHQRVDYPDFAEKAGKALQEGSVERAITICSSGVGVCIAANKMKGVYAAICHDPYSAHQGVEHDGMNMLCLGAAIIGEQVAGELVRAFLNAGPTLGGRYQERINKIKALENREASA